MQQGVGEDFALGVAAPNADHVLSYRCEVLHRARIVATPEGGDGLDHGEHHLAGWHFVLRQALPELGAQTGERLAVIGRGIGEGAVDVRKRDPSPWEGCARKRCYRLTCAGGALQAIPSI